MKRLLILFLLFAAGAPLIAQTDSTCSKILKLYNTLNSNDKNVRNSYKINPASTRSGPLGSVSVYASSYFIPGFQQPEFTEGGGSTRMFTTYASANTYEEATKMWEDFDKQMHNCLTSDWTYTVNDEPKELYKTVKVIQDGSMLNPTIRYYIARNGNSFKLVLEIVY